MEFVRRIASLVGGASLGTQLAETLRDFQPPPPMRADTGKRYFPGDFVSRDAKFTANPGRLKDGQGKLHPHQGSRETARRARRMAKVEA